VDNLQNLLQKFHEDDKEPMKSKADTQRKEFIDKHGDPNKIDGVSL
jgi:hypothetical protein